MNYRLIALFSFIILSWGLAWPINKIGLTYMSPIWYTAFRLIVGTVTMMLLVISIKKFTVPKWRDWPLISTLGLLQISVYILLTNYGLAYLPAGRSSLLAYTTPLWIMPAAFFFFDEKASSTRWLGFILGLAGLIILLSPWELDWTNKDILFGSAMLLLASLSWAISILCARYMHWSKSPLEMMPWQLLIGTLPIVIFACIQEPIIHIEWTMPLTLSLVYTGLLVTGLSYWCGNIITKELPPMVSSLGFLTVPVFSLLLSALFLHEHINLATTAAMVLILLGLAFVATEKKSA